MKEEKSTLKRLKLLPGLFRKQDVEKVTPHAAVFLSRANKKGSSIALTGVTMSIHFCMDFREWKRLHVF